MADGEAKKYAMANVAYAWAQQDPEEAFSWVEAQPPGATRDRSIAQLMTAISHHAPTRALALAQTMGPKGDQRNESLTLAIRALARQSPAQAEQALQEVSGLSGVSTERLQSELALARFFADPRR